LRPNYQLTTNSFTFSLRRPQRVPQQVLPPSWAAQALPRCPTLVTLHQHIWACPSESIPLLVHLWRLPRCTPLGLMAMQLTHW
ncbi:hypothetical protein L0F63_004959, partial [Massospora cicadina]